MMKDTETVIENTVLGNVNRCHIISCLTVEKIKLKVVCLCACVYYHVDNDQIASFNKLFISTETHLCLMLKEVMNTFYKKKKIC